MAVAIDSWIEYTKAPTIVGSVNSTETLSSVGVPSAVVRAPIATISVGRIRKTAR